MRPARVTDVREWSPDRTIGDQRMPAEIFREHSLANVPRLGFAHLAETRTLEACLVELDDERAHVARVAVMMGIAVPEFGRAEGLSQCFEALRRAEPRKPVPQLAYKRSEFARQGLPQERVRAVRPHDEIGTVKLLDALDPAAVFGLDPDRAGTRLKNPQQLQPTHRRKADAVDRNPRSAMHDGDVLPDLEMRHDGVVSPGVVLLEELQRAVGEHHAETEGRVRAVLLDDADLRIGSAPLQQVGEIEPG